MFENNTENIKINIDSVAFTYGNRTILKDINGTITANTITAITGPSGAGKSTFLNLFNRLWEESEKGKVCGKIFLHLDKKGFIEIHGSTLSLFELRRKVGMVFQTPNPLPMSIRENLTFPLQLAGTPPREETQEKIEKVLQKVHLLGEVKDRLDDNANLLSGGQQQRLCLARALMLEPEVLLLDEPTSSLDNKACRAIEELLLELKNTTTLIMVSHYHDQVQRIADQVYELRDHTLHLID